jgi:hypothetical protein
MRKNNYVEYAEHINGTMHGTKLAKKTDLKQIVQSM